MSRKEKINLFIEKFHRFGILKAGLEALFIFIHKFIYFKVYVCLILDQKTMNTRYLYERPEYKYCFMNIDELSAFCSPEEYDFDYNSLVTKFNRCDKCYGVLSGDTLISYGWYSKKSTIVTKELELVYGKQYIYHYKAFTHAKYRGQRLHGIGMIKALTELNCQEAVKGLVAVVEINNFSSLNSFYRIGYRKFGKIYVFRIAGKYFIFHQGDCDHYSFELKYKKPINF